VPYRFTGQDFDQETRLYYHGARYYDPRTSVWQSADPALGAYFGANRGKLIAPSLAVDWKTELAGKGIGGIFNPKNLSFLRKVSGFLKNKNKAVLALICMGLLSCEEETPPSSTPEHTWQGQMGWRG
jgi:hypothetical protein